MPNQYKLSDHFTEFLSHGGSNKLNDLFIKDLYNFGYGLESELLKRYLQEGDFSLSNFSWKASLAGTCYVSTQVPKENCKIGDIWFDIIELTPMVLVCPDGNEALKMWISLHPAYYWQFKAFLNLVSWEITQNYFLKADDLLDKSRFNKDNELGFINDIYHEEAVAYAHWFGKSLLGHLTLEQVREDLSQDELSMILPSDIYVWNGTEHPHSEFLRIASSQKNIHSDIYEEFDSIDDDDAARLKHDAVFSEWYKSDKISLSTAVRADTGLKTGIPRGGYEFIRLLNAAKR